MAEKKHQHYVPQFYLKNFSNDRKMLSILTVEKGILIERAPCRNQCHASYYYQSLEIENALGEIEAATAPIIMKATNQESIEFSDSEKSLLKLFTIYQFFRTTGQRDYLIKFFGGNYSQLSKYYVEDGISSSDFEDYIKKTNGNQFPLEALKMATEIVPLIDDLNISIINFSTKHPLISSDNPVILFNNYYKQCVGFAMAGLVIIMPLSPNKLLLIYDSKMYDVDDKYGASYTSKYSDCLTLNNLQLYNANKIAYSADTNTMKRLKPKLTAARKMRKKKDKNIVTSMGTFENNLIVNQGHWPLLNTDLKFIQLKPPAKVIPGNSRDYFPRQPDEAWIERLSMLPTFAEIAHDHEPERKKRDYEAHIKLVRKYWNMVI